VGFQWWDCFDKFEFCEHILNEWSWTQGKEAQSDAFKKVLRFAEIYPRGFYKHVKGKQPWIEVQHLLGEIADIFHLYDEDDDESSKKQDLRAALTEMYTASYRLSPEPNYDEAERLYQEAIAEAQDEEDPFNESYATAFYADMLLELGRYDEAYEKAEAVNQLMDVEEPYHNERDYEVVTQSYRVMGDVCLFQGRYEDVGHLYSRSAMCGYAQNFALEHDPDPYTLKWYEVNVMLNAQYLVETAQAHSVYEAVETICHDIHATWDSYWKEQPCKVESTNVAKLLKSGDYAQLRLYLSPPAPDPKIFTAEARQEEFNRIVSLFGIPESDEATNAE
jgi:tetratricopeptide (TPR) repeat protein